MKGSCSSECEMLGRLKIAFSEIGISIVELSDQSKIDESIIERYFNGNIKLKGAALKALSDVLIPSEQRETKDAALKASSDSLDASPQDTSGTMANHFRNANAISDSICEILLFAANPDDSVKLALTREVREIEIKIRSGDYRDNLRLIPKLASRPDDILSAMNQHGASIVHFSGHGTSCEEIILEDYEGKAKPLSKRALEELFRTLGENVRLVILNACYSKSQALAIANHVDCAIGMNTAIGDAAAVVFSSAFYRAVAFGKSVKQAFDQACLALMMENIPEENTPELICKDGCDAAEIYILG